MKVTRFLAFSAAAATGVVLGWYFAARHLEQHRTDLFSANRFRRLAALSYLAGQERVETVRLLRDYIAWEPSAALRKRAQRVMTRLELQFS